VVNAPRINEQRVRRGRIQFIKQARVRKLGEYSRASNTPEQTMKSSATAAHLPDRDAGSGVYRIPSHIIQADLDVPAALRLRIPLVEPGADGDMIAKRSS